MALKLCFGIRIELPYLISSLGIKQGDVVFQKCPFCDAANENKGNFCSNCGSDIRKLDGDLRALDILDFMVREEPPPRTISVLPYSDRIENEVVDFLCVCWVMGEEKKGVAGVAEYDKPIAYANWKAIENAIRSHVARYDLPEEILQPHLFAIND